MIGVPPMKKLEDLIHLAELCVDLLQQNEEHYAEVNLSMFQKRTNDKKNHCKFTSLSSRFKENCLNVKKKEGEFIIHCLVYS